MDFWPLSSLHWEIHTKAQLKLTMGTFKFAFKVKPEGHTTLLSQKERGWWGKTSTKSFMTCMKKREVGIEWQTSVPCALDGGCGNQCQGGPGLVFGMGFFLLFLSAAQQCDHVYPYLNIEKTSYCFRLFGSNIKKIKQTTTKETRNNNLLKPITKIWVYIVRSNLVRSNHAALNLLGRMQQ